MHYFYKKASSRMFGRVPNNITMITIAIINVSSARLVHDNRMSTYNVQMKKVRTANTISFQYMRYFVPMTSEALKPQSYMFNMVLNTPSNVFLGRKSLNQNYQKIQGPPKQILHPCQSPKSFYNIVKYILTLTIRGICAMSLVTCPCTWLSTFHCTVTVIFALYVVRRSRHYKQETIRYSFHQQLFQIISQKITGLKA